MVYCKKVIPPSLRPSEIILPVSTEPGSSQSVAELVWNSRDSAELPALHFRHLAREKLKTVLKNSQSGEPAKLATVPLAGLLINLHLDFFQVFYSYCSRSHPRWKTPEVRALLSSSAVLSLPSTRLAHPALYDSQLLANLRRSQHDPGVAEGGKHFRKPKA